MAAGTRTDFKVYNEEFYGGMYEALAQNTAAFNAGTNGAMVLTARNIKGDFEKESNLKRVAGGIIRRRDPSSIGDVADKKVEQGEQVGVKVNRGIGPVAQTLDSWKKIAADPSEFSLKLGRMTGEEKLQEMVNTALACLEAAIRNNAPMVVTKAATVLHTDLVDGLATYGDAGQNVICWAMHSISFFQLFKQQITDKVYGSHNLAIYSASVATLNRPVLVIDAPALLNVGTPNTYSLLGLTAGAIEIAESEDESIESEVVTGKENLLMRVQGEYAFNVKMKGYTWDVANGGLNPTDAALATGSNWDLHVGDNKLTAGCAIIHQ